MHDHQTLIAGNDHLDTLCALMIDIASGDPDLAGALDAGALLSSALADHLDREERRPRYWMIHSRMVDGMIVCRRGFIDLAAECADYLNACYGDPATIGWPDFAIDTIAILQRLRMSIEKESSLLAPTTGQDRYAELRIAA